MASSSSRVNTFPVGLFGVFRMIALVFSLNAAASSSGSNVHVVVAPDGGWSVTYRGVAPPRHLADDTFSELQRLSRPREFGHTNVEDTTRPSAFSSCS